jgi:hypothetical protein
MRRRKFLQYGALGSASFFINLALLTHQQTNAALSTNMSNTQNYDWVFLYWMPYDNNLSRFGQPIIQMLSTGVQNGNLLVIVQSDFSEDPQLSRRIITKGKIGLKYLETANSSSEEVFAEYLNWAKSQFQAKRWAIVFLGHGGRLFEISPDAHPDSGSFSEVKWMNLQKLSNILVKFNNAVDNRVELVFFQNCNKGTLEAHYTFRDTAKYTLSSQLTLGAPNYYYESLLQYLGNSPDIGGSQLAEKIMQFERKDMYHSLTLINNGYFQELCKRLKALIESIVSSDIQSAQAFVYSNLVATKENNPERKLEIYSYYGEKFVDLVEFLQKLTKESGASQENYNDFANFLENSIIHKLQQNGELFSLRVRPRYQNYSGLGLFLPTSRQQLEEYRYLQVYSDLKLANLFDAILLN